MASDPGPNLPLKAAIDELGSQLALAELVGVKQPAVSKWLAKGAPLPAEYVLKVESRTGISRHDIRPDLYPRESPQAASATQYVEAAR
jgi:DNA-binding transcriptional regulator YdaS (Cro superfamily)